MPACLQNFYRRWVLEHAALTLVAVALIAAFLALGLPNFKLDASADSLTLEHDRDIDYFREIYKRYQSGDFLVITYTPQEDLFSDQSLATLAQLRDELKQVEGVASVQSLLDLPLLYSPVRTLGEIKAAPRNLMTPGVDRAAAKREFLESPIYRDMVLSPSGQTTALLLSLEVDNRYIELVRRRDALRLQRDTKGLSAAEQAELTAVTQQFLDYRTAAEQRARERVAEVRKIVGGYRDRAQLFVGGVTMVTSDMIDFIRSDLVVFGIAIVVFIVITLFAIFRQLRFVLLPLAVCLLAVVMMLGGLSWVDWRLTVISSNFVALLLIMTLAINIYLVVRFREVHAERPELSKQELVFDTVRFMARPCLYTALTTIVAFVSLVVSDIRPVIDFGWMMTIGLSLALALSFVVLPAGLMLLPLGQSRDKGDGSAALTLRFSRFAEQRPLAVWLISLAAALLSGFGLTKLEVENRFVDYFREDTEIYQGMSLIDRELGGTTTLDIVLDAPAQQPMIDEEDPFAEADVFDEPDPFETPEPLAEEDPFAEVDPFSEHGSGVDEEGGDVQGYWFTRAGLKQIGALHDYLDSRPEIGKVQSLATAYRVASDINGKQLNDFELAVMQRALPDDVSNFLIKPYLSVENNETRISLRVRDTYPGLKRAELIREIRRYAIDELGFAPQQVHFTGMLVLYNNMLQSLFKSQIVTLGAVFVGIVLMFVALFRSLSVAVVAIIPNMLAAMVVLGSMGWFGIPLDMMTITIAAITVGVGVDHAIHYITRFKRELADQAGRSICDYIAAMHRSHASIGRAMFYTSITIIVGFSILALSEFIPSIYFGLLTAMAMLAAILGSLTLLPRLILLVRPFGRGC